MNKSEKGITLIALIITIIVMLILVAVTVSIAMNGGIFQNARDARDQTKQAVENEKLIADATIDSDGNFIIGGTDDLTYLKTTLKNKKAFLDVLEPSGMIFTDENMYMDWLGYMEETARIGGSPEIGTEFNLSIFYKGKAYNLECRLVEEEDLDMDINFLITDVKINNSKNDPDLIYLRGMLGKSISSLTTGEGANMTIIDSNITFGEDFDGSVLTDESINAYYVPIVYKNKEYALYIGEMGIMGVRLRSEIPAATDNP